MLKTVKTKYGSVVFDSGMMDFIDKIKTQAVGIGHYGPKNDLIAVVIRGSINKKMYYAFDKAVKISIKNYKEYSHVISSMLGSAGRFVIENGKIKYVFDSIILYTLDYYKPVLETIKIDSYRPENNAFVGLNKKSHLSDDNLNTVIKLTDMGTFIFKHDRNIFYKSSFYKKIEKMLEENNSF